MFLSCQPHNSLFCLIMTISWNHSSSLKVWMWSFPSNLHWHLTSQKNCKLHKICAVELYNPEAKHFFVKLHELVRELDYIRTTFFAYGRLSFFFKTTASVSVGVFELVNHRKALPVNLPLDLKDVCGFPLSHQSSEVRWGWMEVIFANVGEL